MLFERYDVTFESIELEDKARSLEGLLGKKGSRCMDSVPTGTVEWNGGMNWTGMEWNDQRNVALLWACPTFDP